MKRDVAGRNAEPVLGQAHSTAAVVPHPIFLESGMSFPCCLPHYHYRCCSGTDGLLVAALACDYSKHLRHAKWGSGIKLLIINSEPLMPAMGRVSRAPREYPRRATIREMKEGPSSSAIRC
jgi:hypothetical protein